MSPEDVLIERCGFHGHDIRFAVQGVLKTQGDSKPEAATVESNRSYRQFIPRTTLLQRAKGEED